MSSPAAVYAASTHALFSIKLVILLVTNMFVHRNTLEPSVLDNHTEHQGM